MGLYDRDYMRADRGSRETGRFPDKHSRFPIWVIIVALIIIIAFLARSF